MPVRKVKGGHRYGKKGKLYRGKGARQKAEKQGMAIRASQARAAGHSPDMGKIARSLYK